jgi:hypothetical protein
MREHVRRNRGKRDVRIPLIAMESTDTNCAASWGGGSKMQGLKEVKRRTTMEGDHVVHVLH